jgi:1-acyl-sn-glycerol-3-phosphate acyltransferase
MGTPLAAVRALRVLLHVITGLGLALLVHLDRWNLLSRERLTQWWNRALLELLEVELRVRGEPLSGARLTVANHVSWLDISVMAAAEPTRFLSKSEVKHWPVAGWFADAAGTFYIRRGKGGARPLLDKLTPHLAAGGSIVLFPEGTTTTGASVLPFHPRLFAAAIDAPCSVQPVAIRYSVAASGTAIAPFVGDDDLVSHLWRVLREPGLVAQVSYGRALAPGQSRDELAAAAQASVVAMLGGPEPAPAQDAEPLVLPHFR